MGRNSQKWDGGIETIPASRKWDGLSPLTPCRPARPHAGRGNRLCGDSYPSQLQRLTRERDKAATSPRTLRRPAEAPPPPGAGVGQGHARYNIPPLSTLEAPQTISVMHRVWPAVSTLGHPGSLSLKAQLQARWMPSGHRLECSSTIRQFAGVLVDLDLAVAGLGVWISGVVDKAPPLTWLLEVLSAAGCLRFCRIDLQTYVRRRGSRRCLAQRSWDYLRMKRAPATGFCGRFAILSSLSSMAESGW